MPISSYVASRHAECIRTVLFLYLEADIGNVPEDASPDVLARASVMLLARKPQFPEREDLAASVAADRRYYPYLIDTSLLSAEQCQLAAETLCNADTAFVVGLIRAADDAGAFHSVMRALEIIEGVDKTMVAAQWIRRLTGHADRAVRSKAVKLLSRVHVNLMFIERQLTSEDARVRANAVEGLWGSTSHAARKLLEKAASDVHHRVATNGLLGLCLAGAPGAVQRMFEAARAESSQLRTAAAWAMGQTGREEFSEELEKLAGDTEASVRKSAAQAKSDQIAASRS